MLKRTRERLELCPIAFQLLPKKFTLTELQKSYEMILKTKLDKNYCSIGKQVYESKKAAEELPDFEALIEEIDLL